VADTPDPAQLAAAVKGVSDDELTKLVTDQGIDTTLSQIFQGMQAAFLPDKAGANSAVVQYDVDTPEGVKSWTVNIDSGECATSEGEAESPRLVMQLPLVHFVRLVLGQADGTQLFMSGKLKLKGDMMFAMQLQNFFQRPS
jgi:putative sterol carrier protein